MRTVPRRSIVSFCLIGLAVGASGSIRAAVDPPDRAAPIERLAPAALLSGAAPVWGPEIKGVGYAPASAAAKTWAVARQELALVKTPGADDAEAGTIPEESYVKILQTRGDWAEVAYGGARGLASPTVAWANRDGFETLASSPRWVRTYEATKIWPSADASTPTVPNLPRWSWLELTGEDRAGRFAVRYPGDGRQVPPGQGWIDAAAVVPAQTPDVAEIPWGYPATVDTTMTTRIGVPYRTQLDNTPWAAANCGPTALTMGLEFLGQRLTSARVRRVVLDAQNVRGDDAGTFIWALAAAAERLDARAIGLYDAEGQHIWTTDDVRERLEQRQPVILQVAYRALPGREQALYSGDHYIILTGLVGDGFLYNDPVDSDGLGYDRVMSAAQLDRAMNATDRRYAHAGFALARA